MIVMMRAEEFIAAHSPHTAASPDWSSFRATLEQTDVELVVRQSGDLTRDRRLRRELLRYLRLEESGSRGTFPRSIQTWGSWNAFETEWAAWFYTSPNSGNGTVGVVIRRENGCPGFTLTDLGRGLNRSQQAAWITSRVLWQSRGSVSNEGGIWRWKTENDRLLGHLNSSSLDWSCVPSSGIPQPHRLRPSYGRLIRATRDDTEHYRLQLVSDLRSFREVSVTIPQLSEAVLTPPRIEVERLVREQNMFTLPEGHDGRLDNVPDRAVSGIAISPQAHLVRTGQVGPVSMWLYVFTDRIGNDVFIVHQLCPSIELLSRVRAFPGYASLTPDQVMLFSFAESLQSHDFELRRSDSSWVIGSCIKN